LKDVVVIGGPNGAGKTTASNSVLPGSIELRHFLNADEIARTLSPSDPDSAAIPAGRLLLDGIEECMRSGASFALETTCAGRTHLQRLRLCRSAGYRMTFISCGYPHQTLPWQGSRNASPTEATRFRKMSSSADTLPDFATCGISIYRLQMSRSYMTILNEGAF
jgi:hypothetical protein